MKTIRMPRALGERWLAALRSGEYKQCTGELSDGVGFCCLGVLEHIVDGKVESDEPDDESRVSNSTPSETWLDAHGVEFFAYRDEGNIRNPALRYDNGDGLQWGSAAELNDEGTPFAEIADILQANMEYTDEQKTPA